MHQLLVVLIVFCSAFVGGLLALRFGKHIHLLTAFAGGILLGACFFELLPEAIELHGSIRSVFVVAVSAFILFHLLQRYLFIHAHSGEGHNVDEPAFGHQHLDTKHLGVLGASGLALHSFLDGGAIGLGFAVNTKVGIVIAAAVIAHAFGDGVSTVTLMLRHKNTRAKTLLLLTLDAVAPIAGAIIAYNIPVGEPALGLMLAFFAGFFLFMSTSDLLPEAKHDNRLIMPLSTIAGCAIMYGISLFVA